MKNSVFRFTLNYHVHRSQVSVPVFLGDTAVTLYISITDGGNAYYIEDGCTAVLRGKKPDGTSLLEYCLIENNTRIRYDFGEQTTSCEGIVNCEINLYGADGNLLTCPKFIIVVGERVARDDEVIESESERSALDAIFASEASRVSAEESRVAAEQSRDERFQTVFVRYSAHPDGTDFTETHTSDQNYIGIATAKEAPTDKSEYDWMRVSGDKGVTQVEYSAEDAVLYFKDAEGKVLCEIDLPIESLVKNARLEENNLVLVLENGTEVTVSTEEIASAIAKNEKSIIPADSVHCRRKVDGIYLTDNSGKTVVIPLLELWSTATDFDTFGLVRIKRAGNGGLALNGGYLVTNPANETELNAKKDDRKPVVSKNFAAGLNANLKAGEGIALSYDETAKEVTVSATGGGSSSETKYMHFVQGKVDPVSGESILFSATVVDESDVAMTGFTPQYEESIPATAIIDGVLYTSLYGNPHGAESWDYWVAFTNANGTVIETTVGCGNTLAVKEIMRIAI